MRVEKGEWKGRVLWYGKKGFPCLTQNQQVLRKNDQAHPNYVLHNHSSVSQRKPSHLLQCISPQCYTYWLVPWSWFAWWAFGVRSRGEKATLPMIMLSCLYHLTICGRIFQKFRYYPVSNWTAGRTEQRERQPCKATLVWQCRCTNCNRESNIWFFTQMRTFDS